MDCSCSCHQTGGANDGNLTKPCLTCIKSPVHEAESRLDSRLISSGPKPPYMYWAKDTKCHSGHDAVDGSVACIRVGEYELRLCRMCEGVLLNTIFNQWMLRKTQNNPGMGYNGPLRKTHTLAFALDRRKFKERKQAHA